MKVLFDTNVILDVLLDRKEFVKPAEQLMSKVEGSEITGYLCANTITTIHYLINKHINKKQSAKSINALMALFEVASVNRLVIENALKLPFNDFEDALLHESARHSGIQHIISRNIRDFKKAKIPVYTPIEFLQMIKSLK